MAKRCFVISVIGKPGSSERKHADDLFEFIVQPVASVAGYDVIKRADHIDDSGVISTQVVQAVSTWEMVIVDLSYPNPNVYYELAIRHFTGRPVVSMMRVNTELPFDVSHVRCVQFELGLREVEDAKKDLSKKLAAAENDPNEWSLNPITQSKLRDELQSTGDVTMAALQALLQGQEEIKSVLAGIQRSGVYRSKDEKVHIGNIARALMDVPGGSIFNPDHVYSSTEGGSLDTYRGLLSDLIPDKDKKSD